MAGENATDGQRERPGSQPRAPRVIDRGRSDGRDGDCVDWRRLLAERLRHTGQHLRHGRSGRGAGEDLDRSLRTDDESAVRLAV